MSCTNDVIQQCNFDMIRNLPNNHPFIISTSRDSCVEENDNTMYDSDFLNRVNVSGIAPHRLGLKVGACIILIKNLSVQEGHVNGTRYIIRSLTNNLIVVEKLSRGSNAMILIPRIPM